MVPHGVYRCKGEDRWIAIEVSNDSEWRSCCAVLGLADLADNPDFSTLQSRKRYEAELNTLVEARTVQFVAEELMARLQTAGVAAGMVKNSRDLAEESENNTRLKDLFWMLKHDEIGIIPHLGQVAKLSKTPAVPRLPAPCLGQHNEYICREFLKLSDEEFVKFFNDGAFGPQV